MRLPISDYTNLLPTASCTVSKLWPIIGQIFGSDRVLHFNAFAAMIPYEYLDKLYLSRN